ncbi:MAG: hypothetical protein KGJ36_03660, partial [Acidobacteriota bacterium]|nr:hypothetical protein [Acidobacteriota bacterium]
MSTPRERVVAEAERRGRDRLVRDLANLLSGGESDARLVAVLGGDHGALVVDGRDGGLEGYWPRVWAARGL